jgi:hypothetical protein
MGIEKTKQELLTYLEMETARGYRRDKQVILAIMNALDFIDDWTMETTERELMNKYSEF